MGVENNATFQPVQGKFCENLLRDAIDAIHAEGLLLCDVLSVVTWFRI